MSQESLGFLGGSIGKEPPANAGDVRDVGLIPGPGRSPGGQNGNPFRYSCWEIPWTEKPGRYSPWRCKELDTTKHTRAISFHHKPTNS